MDCNSKERIRKRINKTIENLQKRNMNGYYIENENELFTLLDSLIIDNMIVSVGGSMTLFESGTINYLKNRNITYLDRHEEGLQNDKRKQLYREAFFADVYLSSTNAITEKGELYNVDGLGNRTAAFIYGPDKVVIIAGYNKIVNDLDEAKTRVEQLAAPLNVKRLNRNTPCKLTGSCMHCNSEEKICNIYTIIDRQFDPNRMHVIFLNKSLGF